MSLTVLSRLLKTSKYISNSRSLFKKCTLSRCSPIWFDDANNSRAFARSMWFLCKGRDSWTPEKAACTEIGLTNACSCGCGKSHFHTKGDKELVEFLEEEIANETKSQKHPALPKVEGFQIKTNEAEVIFTKKFKDENVTVRMNVNHSVDAEDGEEMETAQDQDKEPESGEMKSKPSFVVEIEKKGNTLMFDCSFSTTYDEPQPEGEGFNDLFQITTVAMYENELKDMTYSVSGDIMDGYLYDLLMNMLEERGISNKFADTLVDYCTSYEHKLYIGLLQKLKKFASED